MNAIHQSDIALTAEEQALLNGERGETLRKVMASVVSYGVTFGARRLEPITGAPHLVTSGGANVIRSYLDIVEELVDAGLRIPRPFTVDPRPIDASVRCSPFEKILLKLIYGRQKTYERQLSQLGLRDDRAFTCTCYLPEVGNTPRKGDILAWSESSAVVFANSVLGARSNRNSAGIDLLCNVVGKAPLFGLLTDEGRKAQWLVDVQTSTPPNAQLLGSAIGLRVGEGVPYVVGLSRFLGVGLNDATTGYLKDMGAAAASSGAVGLYHVEGITPEAAEAGRELLTGDHRTYVIDDAALDGVMRSYAVLWKRRDATPRMCFIGCPHLTYPQLQSWTHRICAAARGQARLKVETYLCAAPDVIARFETSGEYGPLLATGARLTSVCPMLFMNNPLSARRPVITSSSKLRTYSTARFFTDESVLAIITTGDVSRA
jgi:predicted aconitase